jgi:hypothetical protein
MGGYTLNVFDPANGGWRRVGAYATMREASQAATRLIEDQGSGRIAGIALREMRAA